MNLKHTVSTQRGESRIWSCRFCGSTICVTHREKPSPRCPGCDELARWHEVHPPISAFAAVEAAEREAAVRAKA